MGDLRAKIEQDTGKTIEGRFGLPVELIGPDGVSQIYSKNDPESLLQGKILYDTVRQNPDTGESVIIEDPVVTLRRSSLNRIPLPGEVWSVRIPAEPRPDADKETYLVSDLPVEGGRSIGFVRLYLTKPEQVPE